MPNRRDAIRMTDGEVADFLAHEKTVVCATAGHDGWPHLMPLWYVLKPAPAHPEIWAWTFGKSQKIRNLERDPRATLQVEAGETYDQLRGVMIEAETVIHRDEELAATLGAELARRYSGVEPDEGAMAAIRAQATKRVALQFRAVKVRSWDHRKLGT